MANNKKILIFGGAFNPPHKGHLHILIAASKYIKPDEIIVCVDKISPWKHVGNLAPFSYRYAMVKNLFDNQINYSIYPNKDNFIYSYQIIDDIARKNPDSDLYFLVGQDQYELIESWNNYEQINKQCAIVCYRRGNKLAKHLFDKHIILSDKIFDCSSTEARQMPTPEQLGEKNCKFIDQNKLYLQHKVMKYMSDRRYEHTLRVISTITQIAMGNNFSDEDILRCQIAATLHDIAKQYTDKQLRTIVSSDELDTFPSYHCAHGLAGARLAELDFGIADKEILEAIDNHVIFKDKALNNKIAKALFCADKLEPARTEEDIHDRQKLFDECCKDLDATFNVVLKLNGEKY